MIGLQELLVVFLVTTQVRHGHGYLNAEVAKVSRMAQKTKFQGRLTCTQVMTELKNMHEFVFFGIFFAKSLRPLGSGFRARV